MANQQCFFQQTNHGTYSNPGTQVGVQKQNFGAGSLSKAKIILFLKMHPSCEYMTLKYPVREPQGQSSELITLLVVSHVMRVYQIIMTKPGSQGIRKVECLTQGCVDLFLKKVKTFKSG